jgi:hypothetical protein
MDLFFFREMNGGLKVTIKVRVRNNLLPQSLQTLARINSLDVINISNRRLFLQFNSLHVKKLFTNAHQNG